MDMSTLVIPALSAVGGWLLRHYGFLAPSTATSQSSSGKAGTVPASPATSTQPSELAAVIRAEVGALLAGLETRLGANAAKAPPPSAPTA